MAFSNINKNLFGLVGKGFATLYQFSSTTQKISLIKKLDLGLGEERENQEFSSVIFMKNTDLMVFKNQFNELFLVKENGELMNRIKMERSFDYIGASKRGPFIFYDDFFFANYIIDTNDYSLKIFETYQDPNSPKISYIALHYEDRMNQVALVGSNNCIYMFNPKRNEK